MPDFQERFHRALTRHQCGDLNYAKQEYVQLLKQQPNSVELLDLMGVLLNQQGLPADSLPFFKKALQQDPNNATLHVHCGNALCALQSFTEALEHFTRAFALNPHYAEAYNNCANVYLRQEKYAKAIEYYQQAIALKPDYYDARCNLSLAYCQQNEFKKADDIILAVLVEEPHHPTANRYQQIINDEIAIAQFIHHALHALHEGKLKEAIEYYHQVLKIQPDNPLAGFHLSALKGDNSYSSAPPRFVANLFDHYSQHYDVHLKEILHYQVPQELYKQVAPRLGSHVNCIVDLGCGTGITGEMFASHATTLVGVDLAQSMLEQAAKKACYTHLHCEDAVHYLNQSPDLFDLILAADMLVYIGDLSPLFKSASQALAPQGIFAFSIEVSHNENYTLLPTARFAHHPQYIKQLAQQWGFTLLKSHHCTLRTQAGKTVDGEIILLQSNKVL